MREDFEKLFKENQLLPPIEFFTFSIDKRRESSRKKRNNVYVL